MFRYLSHRIMAVVGIAVTLGLALTAFVYTREQERVLYAQHERILGKLAETAIEGLQSVMLAGYAESAQDYADRLKRLQEIADFRILRTDGSEAFLDNRTIHEVNRLRGGTAFRPRDSETQVQVLAADNPQFARALSGGRTVTVQETDPTGARFITFLAPIPSGERCHACHGNGKRARGLVKLTASLARVESDIRTARQQSLVMAGVALVITLLLTGALISRSVSRPVRQVTEAMTRAASGDLSLRVPGDGNDEIARMAESFNRMGAQLASTYDGLKREQDKLTTIISSADEGIVVTDGRGKVVLVNRAAEALLGKAASDVVQDGFLNVFDNSEDMQRRLELSSKGPEIILYNNRTLSVQVSTIRDRRGVTVGSAALFRDITEEKRLEEELRRLAVTDPLTGLYNRRHLAEALDKEFERSRRHQLPLSVLMCDVDHFKHFNDQHGHECGDHVLQMVARHLTAALRAHDLPCRYGGEEFLAVLPSTAPAGAYSVAERLRRDIAASQVDGLHITVSIGVASFPGVAADSPQTLIDAADRALYDAKEAGRDRVRVATPRA